MSNVLLLYLEISPGLELLGREKQANLKTSPRALESFWKASFTPFFVWLENTGSL